MDNKAKVIDVSNIGIHRAVKVYNIKNRLLVSDFSNKSRFNSQLVNMNTPHNSTSESCYVPLQTLPPSTPQISESFSLSYLLKKINNLTNDIDTDEEYVLSDSEEVCDSTHTRITKHINIVNNNEPEHETNTDINSENPIIYTKYKKKEERNFFKALDEKDKQQYKLHEDSIQEYRKNNIPLRFKILKLDIPIYTKNYIIEKIDQFSVLESRDNEIGTPALVVMLVGGRVLVVNRGIVVTFSF